MLLFLSLTNIRAVPSIQFKLRPFRADDLSNLVKHANNGNIANNLTDQFPHPYTLEHGRAFIATAMSSHPANIMAIDVAGEVVGAIGIHPQNDIQRLNAEMGYWLAEHLWGKGMMTEAIRRMVNYAFENFAIDRIFARPFGSNLASQKVLEKAGFTQEARFSKTLIKNGEKQDELYYAIRRSEESA